MRGVKVQGHASMMRSNSCPGAIVNTDYAAGLAALRARQQQETREQVIVDQAAQIEQLTNTVQMMAEHLGIELPPGGQDDNSN